MSECDLENLKNEESIASDWAASAIEIYMHASLIMNYNICLPLNSTILGLLTIKPFNISAINFNFHLLTSLDSATLNQFTIKFHNTKPVDN